MLILSRPYPAHLTVKKYENPLTLKQDRVTEVEAVRLAEQRCAHNSRAD